MAFDGFFLREVVREMRETLLNKRIDKIYQTEKYEIIIYFSKQKKHYLYINVSADSPRFYITDEKILKPDTPPMFAMLLRKHLNSAILLDIKQKKLDRIFEFIFLCRDELGEERQKSLIIEIMNRHSNIILIDDKNEVIECIKTVSPFVSKRPMQKGELYTYKDICKQKISETNKEAFINELKESTEKSKYIYQNYSGFSPSISNSIVYELNSDYEKIYNRLIETENTTSKNCYIYSGKKEELSSVKLLDKEDKLIDICEDFNIAYSNFYKKKNSTNILKRETNTLNKVIENIIKKLNKKIKNLNTDIKNAENLNLYNKYGELLLANKDTFNKGDKTVTVYDYYENENIIVPLKENKNPLENSDYYYKKYQKAKSTLIVAKKQIEIAKEDLSYLKRVLLTLEQAESYEEINEIKNELREESFIKKINSRKRKKEKKLPPREFISPNNFKIKVGRNNLQNDELSLKSSNKDHIWLHTKDIPSAHVVLNGNFDEIDESDLLFAAKICAYYSKARESENVPVDYTKIKNVTKPKGAKPGKVIYINQKTIYVTPFIPN
ncbi:MAG: hypothetical protein CSB15_00500 [Clostridiales bacterium]|nr:MAG: hypothetical protein CSB15_00500 [Clostridiales bacterium]